MTYVGSHIWKIRQKYGSDLLLTNGISVIPEDDQGRILLGKRTDTGDWSSMGGGREEGHSAEQNMHAEVREELGWEVLAFKPFGVLTNPEFTTRTYPGGDRIQYSDVLYHITSWREIGERDDEHSEFGWFAPDNLPENTQAGTREMVRMFLEYKKTGECQFN